MNTSEFIWFDGEFVPWADAKVHVLSHAMHYGSSVFEGIRCYDTPSGPAVFRLDEHVARMFRSCKIYRMDIPFSPEAVGEAIKGTVVENGLSGCYIRPLVFRGFGELGVTPQTCPVQMIIAAWEWGAYLGKEALEQGVDVGVSSWRRMAPDTFPAMAKAGGHYTNSQLIRMEAAMHGYAEGIALDINGYACEGSGENLFMVRDGALYTPPLYASVLPGITRDCVLVLAEEAGIEVRESLISREMLYMADELFFSGTAAEISPIRSVDQITVGCGSRGPITETIQSAFFAIVNGEAEDRFGWLTPVK